MLKFELLEDKIALDADGEMGPAIPDHLDYTPPPVLMRPEAIVNETTDFIIDYIENTPVQSVTHPIAEGDFIDREYIWDTDLDNLFRSYACDGEITVREARDLIVDSDDGGYISRFEVFQTINYIYSEDYQHLYNRASQVFLLSVAHDYTALYNQLDVDVDATHLTAGTDSIQPAADFWWNVTRQAEA